jgi:arylsulfatase A-like enzyme
MLKYYSVLIAFGFLFSGSTFGASIKEEKPNFLFILVDDLGWADVKCNNPETFYDTPNIDKLAKNGIRFTNAYASCPVCSPTRASIMTGKYPARLNITDWIPGKNPKNTKLVGPKDKHELPLEEITIAETLKKDGYNTAFFGKWHLGDEGSFPEDQGFDINIGGHHKGSPPGGYYSPYKNPKLSDGPEGEYLPDRLTNETINFIEKNQEKPFFAYLAFYTVHTPIQASNRHIEYYKKKRVKLKKSGEEQRTEHDGITKLIQDNAAYASMVKAMDENIGRLMDKLEELNLNKNTIIIFTSDNGGLSTLFKRGYPTSNEPLRAGKGWCYEGGIRVPGIIAGPIVKSPGSISDFPITSTDFYPTILDMAGLELMPGQHPDGVNLISIINDIGTPERETLYWHYPHYHGSAWTPGAAIRHGDWKLIVFYDKEKTELYNLSSDPSEKNNLANQMPEKTKELEMMLEKWQKSVNAQMPVVPL